MLPSERQLHQQQSWIPIEGIPKSSHHFLNFQDLTKYRASNTTRQLPLAHRSSVGSSIQGQSPSKEASANVKATGMNLGPDELLVLSN